MIASSVLVARFRSSFLGLPARIEANSTSCSRWYMSYSSPWNCHLIWPSGPSIRGLPAAEHHRPVSAHDVVERAVEAAGGLAVGEEDAVAVRKGVVDREVIVDVAAVGGNGAAADRRRRSSAADRS